MWGSCLPEKISTFIEGRLPPRRRRTSMPPTPGMMTSSTKISGRSCSANSTALSPSEPLPAKSQRGCTCTISATRSQTADWSSITSTRFLASGAEDIEGFFASGKVGRVAGRLTRILRNDVFMESIHEISPVLRIVINGNRMGLIPHR